MHKKLYDAIGIHLDMLQTKLVPVLNTDELDKAEAKLKAAQAAKTKDEDYIEFLQGKVIRLRAIAEDTSSPFIHYKNELGSIYAQMKALHDSMGGIGFYTEAGKRGRQAGTKVPKTASGKPRGRPRKNPV